ncbi:hypothetical protein HETIRDRAFT_434334 [Heterobasidion irregulare TC 32-1]|uniref:Uncharacterized protein n=1 Tax=Heterobasidion irregulare (strain TC 32-1) TaxID=747525 RepID=W4K877_HETIT|nr:uncharacterized protein HETIRDRAFT_434334 [Heterobasidion irregulare TC 32-1]ETW82032.1 hypothetical protein HETIRDRAFT_434334 [Heterobasidion irregulare TC 32-1]
MQRDAFYAIPKPCHECDSNRVTKSVTARPQSAHLPSIASPRARPPSQTRPNAHTCPKGQVAVGNSVVATVRKGKARVAQLGRSSAKRGGAPWRATTFRPDKEGAPQRAGFEAKPTRPSVRGAPGGMTRPHGCAGCAARKPRSTA